MSAYGYDGYFKVPVVLLVHEQERQQNRGYSDESSRKKCSENEFERIFRNALDEVKDKK